MGDIKGGIAPPWKIRSLWTVEGTNKNGAWPFQLFSYQLLGRYWEASVKNDSLFPWRGHCGHLARMICVCWHVAWRTLALIAEICSGMVYCLNFIISYLLCFLLQFEYVFSDISSCHVGNDHFCLRGAGVHTLYAKISKPNMSVVLSTCGFAFSFPVGKYALICWRWLRIPFRMILLKQRYMFCAAQKNCHVKLWNNQNLKQMPPTAMDFSCRKLAWKELFSIKDRVLRCFQVCFGDGWGKDSEETSWGFKPHPWRTLQLLVAQGSPFLLMWLLMPNNLTTPWTQLSSLEGSWILQPRATCTSPFLIFSGKICDHDLTGTSLLLMNF